MKQKNFYTAFNILYSYLKEPLGIYQKEQFYRMIFQDIYALTGDGLYDNDSIRKITSGQTLIHRRETVLFAVTSFKEVVLYVLMIICPK